MCGTLRTTNGLVAQARLLPRGLVAAAEVASAALCCPVRSRAESRGLALVTRPTFCMRCGAAEGDMGWGGHGVGVCLCRLS